VFDFDLVFYMYCVKMRMSEQGFWDSPFCKVMKLIDMYKDEVMMQASADRWGIRRYISTRSQAKSILCTKWRDSYNVRQL